MLEVTVETHFVKRAAAVGALERKIKYIARRHATDRMLVYRGRVFLIELKRPGGKAREGQAREHQRLRDAGADVRVLDTIELVDAFFDEVTA